MPRKLLGVIALAGVGVALVAPSLAQEHGGHEGHVMSAAPTTGSWSYIERDNPRIHTRERWQMLAEPGTTNTYVSAKDLSRDERCEAIRAAESVAYDRATRTFCGAPAQGAGMRHDESERRTDLDQGEEHRHDH